MAPNTVKLKKHLDIINEYAANAAITPGDLIELMSTGKVRKHATADGVTIPMFALEDELQGKKITENYAANDQVQCWIPIRGDEVYANLADNQNVAIGDRLTSAGNGALQALTSEGSEDAVIAMALEAVDTTNSAVATARIKVRVV